MVATRDYDSYGNLTVNMGSARTPFGYSGEYTDAESGLVYPLPRYYDPPTQQFLTKDTMLTQLPYSYGNGNPTNFTDPSGSGHSCCCGRATVSRMRGWRLLITVGVVLTAEAIAIIHDAWERQQASNPVCLTKNSRRGSRSAGL